VRWLTGDRHDSFIRSRKKKNNH